MAEYRIYPLCLGTLIRDISLSEFLQSPGTKRTLPIMAFYVTDGREKILVDTGGLPADGIRYMPYQQTEEQFLDRQLERLGVRCEDIEHVIITHLHWDHCSNNHLFPGARFYVQKSELQAAAAPLPIYKNLYPVPLIFQTEYEVLDGDAEILPGVKVILTPGHSDGSQTVLVDTEADVYAVCGDFVPTYRCWESTPKIVSGLHTDIYRYYASYDKLAQCCRQVLPGHDLKVLNQKCYPGDG